MRDKVWLGMLWLCLVLLPAVARGDGGFIPATAFERVQIPDQRALIHFAGGKETLVIDTAFLGEGTNFAWLIPVPSVPTVEPATTGLFTTLYTLFQPKIVHEVVRVFWFEVILGCVIAWVIWKRWRGESVLEILLVLGLLLLLASLLLPALGTAGAGAISASAESVTVLERKRVGVYETATLQSRDGLAVFEWLKQNGFVTPTNFVPAIRSYAQEGWYFVASKLRLEAPLSEAAKAHPLALTFQTERPVYPLRLTGINNESCQIELYIFGPSRAELPHFTVERCGLPSYPMQAGAKGGRLGSRKWRPTGLPIRHPLLRRLVDGSAAATKLVGRLNSQQMQQDAYVTWTPLRDQQLTRYSWQGAAVLAANCAVPVLLAGLLGLLWSCLARGENPTWAGKTGRVSRLLILVGLVGGGTIYAALPKTSVVASRFPQFQVLRFHNAVLQELTRCMTAEAARRSGQTKLDARWARQRLAATSDFRRELSHDLPINPITGEDWREEDSPGNYQIRETPAGLAYVWYDPEGGEDVMPLVPQPGARDVQH